MCVTCVTFYTISFDSYLHADCATDMLLFSSKFITYVTPTRSSNVNTILCAAILAPHSAKVLPLTCLVYASGLCNCVHPDYEVCPYVLLHYTTPGGNNKIRERSKQTIIKHAGIRRKVEGLTKTHPLPLAILWRLVPNNSHMTAFSSPDHDIFNMSTETPWMGNLPLATV